MTDIEEDTHERVAECDLQNGQADWLHGCDVCSATPTIHPTGLCGPCCFGETDTLGEFW